MNAYALFDNSLSGPANVARGAHEWANNCSRCHNLRSPTEFNAKNWQPIMLHMREQAGLTGQDARDIYAFLANQSANSRTNQQTTLTDNPKVAFKPLSASVTTQHKHTQSTVNKSVAAATLHQDLPQKKDHSNSTRLGETIYMQTCVVCHGANGKGAIPGTPDFTSSKGPLKNSDKILLERTVNGYQSPGSPMAMPPKGGNPKLSDNDLKQVIRYIRNKFGK